MSNPLAELPKLGQSVWFDQMERKLVTAGKLQQMIDEDDLRGLTSNPTIFEKAIAGSDDYDAQLRNLTAQNKTREEIYDELVLEDRRHREVPPRRRQRHERHIDPVLLECAQDLRRIAGLDHDLELRQAAPQRTQGGRQQIDAGGGAGAEPQPSAAAFAMVGDRGERAGHSGVDLVHVGEQIAAGGGRMRPAADALDQPHAEPALQLLDLQADRRLRQVETACRGGKAAKLHHVGERLQVVEAEPAHGSKYYLSTALFQ